MRQDHAIWTVRPGVVVSLPLLVPVDPKIDRSAKGRIERRGVHRIPPREP
jgi:hypothetical protein